jgi:hypothetical protein
MEARIESAKRRQVALEQPPTAASWSPHRGIAAPVGRVLAILGARGNLEHWVIGHRRENIFLVAGVIFGVVALLHLVRILMEWRVTIGDWSIPMRVS